MKDKGAILLFCVFVSVASTTAYRYFQSEWIHFRAGENEYQSGKYQAAAICFQRALDEGLEIPEVFFHLAESQLRSHQVEDAVETLRRFTLSSAYAPETAHRLSDSFIEFGAFSQAIQLLRPVISVDPDNRRARFRLAQVLTWTGNFDEAIGHYKVLLGDKL